MRYTLSLLLSLALTGITLLGISAACASSLPASAADQALAGIATRYGRTTADDVASAFEYPGFHK
jgi:hypothetical protein